MILALKKIFIFSIFWGKYETWFAFNVGGVYVVNYSLLLIG
jgi:hypothetical protein